MTSPTSAVCSEPSPSITSTPPSPGSESTDLSSALSSKQRTVVIGPANCGRPPYWRELQVAAAHVGADLVDQVSGGAGLDGHRSMLAIGPVSNFGSMWANVNDTASSNVIAAP